MLLLDQVLERRQRSGGRGLVVGDNQLQLDARKRMRRVGELDRGLCGVSGRLPEG